MDLDVCCVSSSYLLLSLGDCLQRSKYSGGDTGETKTEVCIDPGIYHCCKSCAAKRETRYIPQDLLFDIFLHLPAKVLYDVIGHVSREWNLMIRDSNFIHHHLRNSTKGILIQDMDSPPNAIYVEMRRGRLEICKLDLMRFRSLVKASCNGLLLSYEDLCVINPSTNQWTGLPPYFDQRHDEVEDVYLYLTFVEASMEYKVVRASLEDISDRDTRMKIAVLTVGVDKVWRHIDTKHLPQLATECLIEPLVSEAYIHWWIASSFVMTFNAETEIIWAFGYPRLGNTRQKFLSMGNYLSLICESDVFVQDFWEMNPETGQWTMLLSIDLKPLTVSTPFGWLVDREVLLLSCSHFQKHCVAYNIKTREAQSFQLDAQPKSLYNFQAHVNSLVRLEEIFPVIDDKSDGSRGTPISPMSAT